MPLIALTKSDGLVLNTPAGSITGVFTTALNTAKESAESPGVRSVITTTVRGLSVHTLAHPAKDVLEQIKAGLGKVKPQDFLILSGGDDDINAIPKSAIVEFEQIKRDEKTLIKVHFTRHDGEATHVLVNDDPENNARLAAFAAEEE